MTAIDGVLVVGGGAVGLTTALSLAQRGVPVTVLEAAPELVKEYRASTFHPPTLEMLDELGVVDDFIAQGLVADKLQFRDRGEGLIAEFDLALLEDDTRFPFRLQCEQYILSQLAFEHLRQLPNAQVMFGHTVTGASPVGDRVEVTVETPEGPEEFTAPYVVGADGGSSAVRRALGIDFEGETYPNRYLVLFTTFDFPKYLPGLALVNYVSDPHDWLVLLRSPGVWRVLFPTWPDEVDEEIVLDESVRARLRGIVPAAEPFPVVHRALYKVHQRIARSYRQGRVLLAGDAAHVNNPLGGMGLNGGIHDAMSLSAKLAGVWHGSLDDAALDAYVSERRQIAVDHIQSATHRNAMSIAENDPAARRRQHEELRKTAANPRLAHQFLLRTSMIESLRGGPNTGADLARESER